MVTTGGLPSVAMSSDPFTLALHADADIADGPDLAPPIHVASTYDRSGQQVNP